MAHGARGCPDRIMDSAHALDSCVRVSVDHWPKHLLIIYSGCRGLSDCRNREDMLLRDLVDDARRWLGSLRIPLPASNSLLPLQLSLASSEAIRDCGQGHIRVR